MTYAELMSGEAWDDDVTPEQAVAAVKAARLEIGRLRAESKLHEAMADLFQAERDNPRDKLKAEVARLRKALKPFAQYVDKQTCTITMIWQDGDYKSTYTNTLKPDHFFAAAAALTPAAQPDTAPPPSPQEAPKPGPGSA